MTDRLTMVTELGSLATEATQRGDDRAVDILRRAAEHLMAVHGDLLKLEDRKRRDRDRKPKVPRKSTESAENAESTEIPAPPYVSPHTLSKTQHDAPAREVPAVDVERIERLTTQLARTMADVWPDADAFLKRREYRTWVGWLPEMLLLIGPGSQFVAEDLAQVCRDDAALDRPIGSPKGLRIFLGSARNERLNPEPAKIRPRQPESVDAALDTWAKTNPTDMRTRRPA